MNIFTKPPVIIFSVCNEELDSSLCKLRGDVMEATLSYEGIAYKRVTGCYKGNIEESFIVNAKYEERVQAICKDYEQEKYFYIDGCQSRQSYLVDVTTGVREHLGEFKRVVGNDVSDIDCWTLDATGQYWSTYS